MEYPCKNCSFATLIRPASGVGVKKVCQNECSFYEDWCMVNDLILVTVDNPEPGLRPGEQTLADSLSSYPSLDTKVNGC